MINIHEELRLSACRALLQRQRLTGSVCPTFMLGSTMHTKRCLHVLYHLKIELLSVSLSPHNEPPSVTEETARGAMNAASLLCLGGH